MIFIDASSYVAILNPYDSLHKKALELSTVVFRENNKLITSYAVLGEVLTVGSMRYNRQASIDFVARIHKSNTEIILEDKKILEKAFDIFRKIKNKDVGFVDCYSFAIIEHYKIEKVFSFDKAFAKYAKSAILK